MSGRNIDRSNRYPLRECNYGKEWKGLAQKDVYVRTFDRMKGMEFTAVFIPYLHRFFAPGDDPEDNRSEAEAIVQSDDSCTLPVDHDQSR